MPYTISWYQPERILMVEVEGVLTTTEIRSFAVEGYHLVAAGKPLVHVIYDGRKLTEVESVPETLKAVQAARLHPNLGWMVVVGTTNPLITFVADFIGTLTHLRYRRFKTVAEGLTFLGEKDPTLISL